MTSPTRAQANLADRQPTTPLHPAVVAEEVLVPLSAIDQQDTTYATRITVASPALQAALAQDGQINAVHLLAQPGGPHLLLAGFSRCHSAAALGWTHIRAIVHTDLSPAEAWRLAWQDNVARRSMTLSDRQWTVGRLLHAGHTQTTVAGMLGVPTSTIGRDAQYARLPAAVRRQVGEAGFSVRHALALVQPLQEQPSRAVGPLLADVRASEPDLRTFQAMVRRYFGRGGRRGASGVTSNGSRLTIDESRLNLAVLSVEEAVALLGRLDAIRSLVASRVAEAAE